MYRMLACPCLNVKLYVKEVKPPAGRVSGLISGCGDKQFIDSLGEVTLDKSGITFEHEYLVHHESFSSYRLYQCLSCKTKTHLIEEEDEDLVLVNTDLESDSAVLERLKNSPNYSKPFKIVLLKPTDISGNAPDPRGFESLQSNLNEVQQRLNHYILEEEEKMEEEIRRYEEEKRAAFQLLKDQLKADKRKMISLVLVAAEAKDDTGDKDMDFLPSHDEPFMPMSSPAKNSINKKKKSDMRLSSKSFSGNLHSDDSEAMFIFDELDEGPTDEPFYESEEDDLSPMKSKEETHRPRKRQNLYSSSVPISVPSMWGRRHPSTEDEDEEDEDTPSDPEQIADKMQALAESITDSGRYIFGDRPRPRLNTGEFIH